MMYSGDFDGSAAFSGGGFMPSQATQTHDSSYSPSKKRDVRTLIPLTVKQLSSASSGESNFSIDGVDLNTVVLVGRVCNKDNKLTEFSFIIDDGTGRIECIKWVHERVDSDEGDVIMPGMYVRVHGMLKSIQGNKSLNVFSIRPVMDFNEIVHHFLECMYVHLYHTRLQGGSVTQPQVTNPTMSTPLKGYQTGTSNQFPGQFNDDGTKSISQMVLNYLNQPACLASEAGVHCNIISQHLKIPVDRIREALEFLANEGFVYSTTDDYCFKSTANA